MDWTMIVKALGVVGVGSTAIVYLAKVLASHLLSVNLEWYKKQLDTTREIEIERLKAELRKAAFEHETRFGRLHERRAEVVAELYARLVGAEQAVDDLDDRFSDPSCRQHVEEAIRSFSLYERENALYLPEELCRRLGDFTVSVALVFLCALAEHGASTRVPQDRAAELAVRFRSEIPDIRAAIEQAFRRMLGVEC